MADWERRGARARGTSTWADGNRLDSGSSPQRATRAEIDLVGPGAISFHPLESARSLFGLELGVSRGVVEDG